MSQEIERAIKRLIELAKERDENDVACVLLILQGSMIEGTTSALSKFCSIYANKRLDLLKN